MKKILKILTIGILGILLSIFLFIQYLMSDLNKSIDLKEIQFLKSDIQSTKELPEAFVKVYNSIEPLTNTTGKLYDWIFENYDRNCPCLDVASFRQDITINKSRISGNSYVLAWKLEKNFTQKECLNYLANNYDFLYNNFGIEQASKFYFESSIDSLTEEQMIILTLMFKNPVLYNPKNHPDIINKKLKEIKTKHNIK